MYLAVVVLSIAKVLHFLRLTVIQLNGGRMRVIWQNSVDHNIFDIDRVDLTFMACVKNLHWLQINFVARVVCQIIGGLFYIKQYKHKIICLVIHIYSVF